MRNAFNTELRHQREHTREQLDLALRSDDEFLASVLMSRLEELDELAAHHGVDVAI
ncbi:MAG TPA: hypothetical protein VHD81_03750 [Mycobacteriales bacterium]|nr:hypothetical protein [Mycobacteriales bacterium]